MAMIIHCGDGTLFSSALLLAFVYALIILNFEFCEHYYGILLHLITLCYPLLACFLVGIVYIPVQKLIFQF